MTHSYVKQNTNSYQQLYVSVTMATKHDEPQPPYPCFLHVRQRSCSNQDIQWQISLTQDVLGEVRDIDGVHVCAVTFTDRSQIWAEAVVVEPPLPTEAGSLEDHHVAQAPMSHVCRHLLHVPHQQHWLGRRRLPWEVGRVIQNYLPWHAAIDYKQGLKKIPWCRDINLNNKSKSTNVINETCMT